MSGDGSSNSSATACLLPALFYTVRILLLSSVYTITRSRKLNGDLSTDTLRLAGRISPPNSSLRRMRFFLSTLLLLPVLNAAHVASMAILGGARTWAQVEATVRRAAIPASLVTAPVLPLLAVLGAGTPNEDAWALACAGVVTAFATVFRAAWMASK